MLHHTVLLGVVLVLVVHLVLASAPFACLIQLLQIRNLFLVTLVGSRGRIHDPRKQLLLPLHHLIEGKEAAMFGQALLRVSFLGSHQRILLFAVGLLQVEGVLFDNGHLKDDVHLIRGLVEM